MTATAIAAKRQHRAVVTRDKILAKAAHLFDQHGYSATSVNDICTVGITKGAVYYHFASKDEIARALIAVWVDEATAIHAETASGDHLANLLTLLERFADTAARHTKLRAGLKLTLDRQITTSDVGYAAWTRLIRKRVRAAVDAGLLTDTPGHHSRNAISAVLVGHLFAPEPLDTLRARVTDTTRVLVRGFEPDAPLDPSPPTKESST
ncbi:TetR/AcrR family transcriptional regulator [Rhodococcus erythropolis]|uniref:TetR/AcrR family transcriptional regulator n=1 Tax=Rhodococcus erythropolis TaxID=1833 RepID=UPI0024BB4D89|nr:TetR/AcrR family transcriptional regulator [Rhodococcus erythropolis]MDJ0403999.1 TetR/AcrR family transcriptional regulator [Rhodococcus erythropolis]